jgi:hypothetical protein
MGCCCTAAHFFNLILIIVYHVGWQRAWISIKINNDNHLNQHSIAFSFVIVYDILFFCTS